MSDAKQDIMQPKFGSHEYLAAEVERLRAINKDLLDALEEARKFIPLSSSWARRMADKAIRRAKEGK